jgi:hypothetical protein
VEVDPLSSRTTITDVGSSYGTAVDGRPAEAHKPVALRSGSVIVLGQSANCSVFSPSDFFDYLQGLLRIRET